MKRACEACGRARPPKKLTRKCPDCGGRFVPVEVPAGPVSSRGGTSRAAAKNAEAFMGRMQRRVLDALVTRAQKGGTDEEVMEDLGTSPNGVRPRRVELEARGLVGDSGERRKTRYGLDAIVWVATEAGRSAALALKAGRDVCLKRVREALSQAETALAQAKRVLDKTPCACERCTERALGLFDKLVSVDKAAGVERGPDGLPSRLHL